MTTQIASFAGRQRAFLKVQDGCDAFCSYCIIPQVRPRPASKPIDVALNEARGLVAAGHKEIILTGIYLGAYGRQTARRNRWSENKSQLADLLRALAGIEGLERLRLSSLEPGDVDETLLEVLRAHPNCVPHLHLPLQSGSTDVLRRMNRQYTRDAYLETVEQVKHALDLPAISTDLMVGFPGETDEDFEASLAVARQVEFCKIHAFPFSPRKNTAAARWKDEFIPSALVRERMQRLGDVERERSLRFRRSLIGHSERVIVERIQEAGDGKPGSQKVCVGRADRYFPVHFASDEVSVGDLVSVRIDQATPSQTHGTPS